MAVDSLKDSLAFNISRVSLLLRRSLIKSLDKFDISPEQWQILSTLWNNEKEITQRTLSESILKDKHAISKMILKLEKNGYVSKKASPLDKRKTIIVLTAKGKEIESDLKGILTKNAKEKIFKGLTQKEKESTLEIMKKIRQNMNDEI